jgi:hypothetical protein
MPLEPMEYVGAPASHVVAMTGFPDTGVFASFGLPCTLSE